MNSSLANTTKKGKNQMKSSHSAEAKKERSCIPSASCQILQKRCIRGNLKGKHCEIPCSFSSGSHVLSTVKIFEMARAQLLHHTSKKEDDSSISSNSLSGLSPVVSEDLELALLLQASAEMFSKRHYERATELLSLCNNLSASPTGTPVQRVVHYFGEVLRERIDKETKSITGLLLDRPGDFEVKPVDLEELLLSPKPHSERRLHLIDFGIRSGSHWIILMQVLANRGDFPFELLKITAIGTSKQKVDETGKRLSSFAAENMKFSFFFKAVVSEMKDISKDLFELDTNEVVAVYSEYSPVVFLYAALFDCLETFMGRDNQYRMEFEGLILRKTIHNMIICEGERRIFRNVRLKVWRALFEKFGIKETELSESSLYQANLMTDRSAHGFCTLDMDGNCLIVKWKGNSNNICFSLEISPRLIDALSGAGVA
ncbi:GRAS family protein RAM1-like [Solanum dulcamara]|uniref:GRAS family protein RAM1-like n=1 Tax=Solanum dulcamara TaxID=45834 RepID=UPI00248646A1|nr:GRAS family protein RAM1-like [Solanum dulcamara]